MSKVTITCPHCGFSKGIDKAVIPARFKSIKCPECQQSFQLSEMPTAQPQAASHPAAAASPPVASTPQVPVSAASANTSDSRRLQFSFAGNAKEYFGIWIVNTLLKIVTFGIYSPWAKVRKRRYFYGNTLLDNVNFDYLADPVALLKGWLLGAAFFIVYSIGSQISPLLGGIFGLIIFFAVPWVIVRSRLFNNRNSAHRNVRFNFRPNYADSYTVYAWLPMAIPFTLGLLGPYVFYRQKKFLVENNSYGHSFFGFDATAKEFYIVALKTVGFAILFFGGLFTIPAMFAGLGSGLGSAVPATVGFLVPIGFLAGYLFLFTYGYVRTANLVWNGTFLGKNRFESNMRVRDMCWIMFSNMVAAVISFGLLVPWASVRLARYRLDKLALLAGGDLDQYVGSQQDQASAAGEEIGEFFDVDFGI